ncbi:MAG: Rrf2 family transcriptional regulator [Planctomycetota bacterium]
MDQQRQEVGPRPGAGRLDSVLFSATCAYALRAMSRLSAMREQGYASIAEICEGTDLPSHFIAKIFQDLTRAGLLASAKGRGGGFALKRNAGEIALYDIVEVVDGVKQYTNCVVGLSKCDDMQPCAQHECVKPIRRQILSYLKNTTLDVMRDAVIEKHRLTSQP